MAKLAHRSFSHHTKIPEGTQRVNIPVAHLPQNLRNACSEALASLAKEVEFSRRKTTCTPTSPTQALHTSTHLHLHINQELPEPTIKAVHFLPFKIGCGTSSNKIRLYSLEGIEKLVSYGFLTAANMVDAELFAPLSEEAEEAQTGSPNSSQTASTSSARVRRRMVDAAVEAVYECCRVEDERVQEQAVKAMQTIVTSANCDVHARSMVLAVRTCFQIFLRAKGTVSLDISKSGLSQMLGIAMQRLERAYKHASSLEGMVPHSGDTDSNSADSSGGGVDSSSGDIPHSDRNITDQGPSKSSQNAEANAELQVRTLFLRPRAFEYTHHP